MENLKTKAALEAVKELARLVLMFAVPELIEYFSGAVLDPVTKIMIIGGLRGLDKFMHKVGKDSDNSLLAGGLTRF